MVYLQRAVAVPSPSLDAATELRELQSNSADHILSSANRARDEKRWADAIAAYDAFLALSPEAANIWVQLGDCWKNSENGPEAEKAYLKALELDPGNPRAADIWAQCGHALMDSGDVAGAEKAYLKTLELDPNNAQALFRLGRVKQLMNDVAAAERYLRRAAALPSAVAEAAQILRELRSSAARILASAHRARNRGRWREAINGYRAFLSSRPEAANVWLHLGDCLRESGDSGEAERAYLKSYELDPKLPLRRVAGPSTELSSNKESPAASSKVTASAVSAGPKEDGERKPPQAGGQAHAFRMEFGSRTQRPLPDSPGAVSERASGRFLSEIVSLPAGRYRARVQIMFSEFARGEPIVVNVQGLTTGRVFDQVEMRAELNNREVADQIYLSFTLDKQQAVEFYGWVGAHCDTTLLRLLTILDDPLGSVVASDFDFPTPMRPSIRDLKEVSIGSTGVCNASCVHCPTNKKGFQMPHGRMSAALFEKIVRELAGADSLAKSISASLPSRWKTRFCSSG